MRIAAAAIAATWLLSLAPDPVVAQAPPRGRPAPATPAPKARTAEPPAAKTSDKNDKSAPVTVDADQLESLQKEGLIIFSGSVVARQDNSTQWSDRMEVYLDAKGDRIVRTVSTGSVKIITKDCKTGTANRAEYYDAEQRVILIGNARVWQDDNVVTGERITIYLAEDRSVVEAGRQERVKAVFYPKKDDGKTETKTAARAPGAPCS
jgi:lipopolysaccharide export system protein LptA